MEWQTYGDGFLARTEFGTYTVAVHRLGFECAFHCYVCKHANKIVVCDSDIERVKLRAAEHHAALVKRYEEFIKQ